MRTRPSFALGIVLITIAAAANAAVPSATLKPDIAALAPAGGTLTLMATTRYYGRPNALGWAIVLPPNWSLVSVGGGNRPDIAAAEGAEGTLEFAYLTIPAGSAEFSIVLRYPAGVVSAKIGATVVLRADGKLSTLSPTPVEVSAK